MWPDAMTVSKPSDWQASHLHADDRHHTANSLDGCAFHLRLQLLNHRVHDGLAEELGVQLKLLVQRRLRNEQAQTS